MKKHFEQTEYSIINEYGEDEILAGGIDFNPILQVKKDLIDLLNIEDYRFKKISYNKNNSRYSAILLTEIREKQCILKQCEKTIYNLAQALQNEYDFYIRAKVESDIFKKVLQNQNTKFILKNNLNN
jgi:hypothetical protein